MRPFFLIHTYRLEKLLQNRLAVISIEKKIELTHHYMNKTIPMDWTAEDIKNNAFTYYELDNDSRSLSGYHVYMRRAFEGYKQMDKTCKLTYIMETQPQ